MSIISDFKQFALRGGLVDMAVGFTVGAAFSTIAKSLVDDIVMPVLGLLIGKADFTNLYILLKAGEKIAPPYATLKDAHAAGAVTINYGVFVNNIIAFLLVAIAMFLILRLITNVEKQFNNQSSVASDSEKAAPTNKECPFCFSSVAIKATRCAFCTSEFAKGIA